MFDDQQYGPAKNKTIELLSVLLHRRFTSLGREFSETIIRPDNALSKENMASKLAFSTFADVRNTMFAYNIPANCWSFFAPRMKKEARYHEILAGKRPVGPFEHHWGKAGRYLAGCNVCSLFLVLGVPFEATDTPAENDWTFLGDHDANSAERGEISSLGTLCVARRRSASDRFTQVDETFESLFAFRKTVLPTLQKEQIPHMEEETSVCHLYGILKRTPCSCGASKTRPKRSTCVTAKRQRQNFRRWKRCHRKQARRRSIPSKSWWSVIRIKRYMWQHLQARNTAHGTNGAF